jgi:hypothetical protein
LGLLKELCPKSLGLMLLLTNREFALLSALFMELFVFEMFLELKLIILVTNRIKIGKYRQFFAKFKIPFISTKTKRNQVYGFKRKP